MVIGYFHRLRSRIARNYRQHVRVEGESGMDTLLGTMIGVLFLAVISASFAGVFMAYTVSTAKASENTDRINVITRYSSNTLNNLYVESGNGSATATAAGWSVKSHNKALSATPALAASADFKSYTYAAERPLVSGGTIKVSQWGKNEKGLVTLYTALPKAGSQMSKCNWSETKAKLETLCNVAIDTVQSVVDPPVGVESAEAILWEQEIDQHPWVNSSFNWADATKRSVKTSRIGDFDPKGKTEIRWVIMFDDLTPNKKVSIDFVDSDDTVYTHNFTPTPVEGETGKLTRSAFGVIALPSDVTNVTAYIDTDMSQPTANDQTVKVYRFIVYTKK